MICTYCIHSFCVYCIRSTYHYITFCNSISRLYFLEVTILKYRPRYFCPKHRYFCPDNRYLLLNQPMSNQLSSAFTPSERCFRTHTPQDEESPTLVPRRAPPFMCFRISGYSSFESDVDVLMDPYKCSTNGGPAKTRGFLLPSSGIPCPAEDELLLSALEGIFDDAPTLSECQSASEAIGNIFHEVRSSVCA